eukprot:TRINITY_DN24417_c0_g2_i1.p1 TRINITY_DN24417_c0_g2~~TRINITY_DN24417_c0_g2_i1.p1  ORF type:complete len:937 (+),score=165.31 TRINITY_DN24417_c0_g2_i1:108-2918(+)
MPAPPLRSRPDHVIDADVDRSVAGTEGHAPPLPAPDPAAFSASRLEPFSVSRLEADAPDPSRRRQEDEGAQQDDDDFFEVANFADGALAAEEDDAEELEAVTFTEGGTGQEQQPSAVAPQQEAAATSGYSSSAARGQEAPPPDNQSEAQNGAASRPQRLRLPPPIQVFKEAGKVFGALFDVSDPMRAILLEIEPGGCLDQHNAASPEGWAVAPGAALVSVGGQVAHSKDMVGMLRGGNDIAVIFQTPRRLRMRLMAEEGGAWSPPLDYTENYPDEIARCLGRGSLPGDRIRKRDGSIASVDELLRLRGASLIAAFPIRVKQAWSEPIKFSENYQEAIENVLCREPIPEDTLRTCDGAQMTFATLGDPSLDEVKALFPIQLKQLPKWGLEVRPATSGLGLQVVNVPAGGPAASAGLRPRQIIVMLNGERANAEVFRRIRLSGELSVEFLVLSYGDEAGTEARFVGGKAPFKVGGNINSPQSKKNKTMFSPFSKSSKSKAQTSESVAVRGLPNDKAHELFSILVAGGEVELTLVDPEQGMRERTIVIPHGPGPLGLEMKASTQIAGLTIIGVTGRAAAAGAVDGEIITGVQRYAGGASAGAKSSRNAGVTSCVYSYYSGRYSLYAGPECVDGAGPEEFIEKIPPLTLADGPLTEQIGPPDPKQLFSYLRSFSYQTCHADSWPSNMTKSPRWPRFTFGEINGHHEEKGHTWYHLLCHIKTAGVVARHWCVRRRLHHLRKFLHDPVKESAGDLYRLYFEDCRFAKHGGLAGTTAALRAWLKAWSAAINAGQVPPSLVGLTLRFLEAPAMFDVNGDVLPGSATPEEVMKRAKEAAAEDGNNMDPTALFWISQGGAHPVSDPVNEESLRDLPWEFPAKGTPKAQDSSRLASLAEERSPAPPTSAEREDTSVAAVGEVAATAAPQQASRESEGSDGSMMAEAM